jgi:2-polyprenyl-3-methyl-5-hydroxy-6-metoxy-1,4-benzoquinol methylase
VVKAIILLKMDKSKVAVEIFDKLAGEYEKKFMDVSVYAPSLDLFCNSISPSHSSLLEIACGPGNITSYILKARPGLNILGIDLSPNMICLAKKNNPTAEFQLMDCRNIDQLERHYDAVICGFCIPYLSKPEVEKLFRDISSLLDGEAVLYLSTMEDKYEHSTVKKASSGDAVFVHYYEADYLSGLLKANGFEIIDLARYGSKAVEPSADIDLVMIARKKKTS